MPEEEAMLFPLVFERRCRSDQFPLCRIEVPRPGPARGSGGGFRRIEGGSQAWAESSYTDIAQARMPAALLHRNNSRSVQRSPLPTTHGSLRPTRPALRRKHLLLLRRGLLLPSALTGCGKSRSVLFSEQSVPLSVAVTH